MASGGSDKYHQARSASSHADLQEPGPAYTSSNKPTDGLQQWQAARTLQQQLKFHNRDFEQSPLGLHVSSLTQDQGVAPLELGVKDLPDRILCQTFPFHPDNWLWFPQVCPKAFRPCHLIELTNCWWSIDSSACLFAKCPKHTATGPMI